MLRKNKEKKPFQLSSKLFLNYVKKILEITSNENLLETTEKIQKIVNSTKI